MEAELIALDTAIVETGWLHELLMNLLVVEKPLPAILINCDSQTVIAQGEQFKGQHEIIQACEKAVEVCP
jgi:hypothetical protein